MRLECWKPAEAPRLRLGNHAASAMPIAALAAADKLAHEANKLSKTGYGQYLLRILKERSVA